MVPNVGHLALEQHCERVCCAVHVFSQWWLQVLWLLWKMWRVLLQSKLSGGSEALFRWLGSLGPCRPFEPFRFLGATQRPLSGAVATEKQSCKSVLEAGSV
ncbi:unnamed protein product [Durusdinium trenchii]|uniref:Uncharacterized protein n=1 Tax=Durusdinium trenchii TaxID=1381693 RepID=A0ABP0KCJ6_9DINO